MELNDLLPLLREKCPGVLNQQAKDQLKKAYRNFCIESCYVQRTETVLRELDGSVALTPDDGYYIHSIASVDSLDGKELRASVDYKVSSGNDVKLTEGFSAAIITYSIVPKLPMSAALGVDDEMLQRWPDEIAAGGAATLRLMPNQAWSDPQLSDYYQRDFVKGHRAAFRARVAANDERQFQPQSKREFF